jgi:hypothetical protein
MKKLSYTAPSVEVTRWESQDIITTSVAAGLTADATSVAKIGDSNVTVSKDFADLQ